MFELSVRGIEIRLHRERASLREKDELKLNTKGASKVDEFTDQLDAKRRSGETLWYVSIDFCFRIRSHTHTHTP